LLLDALKGTVAVLAAGYFKDDLGLYAGLAAFLGHIFPVWLNFRGGKGVATYLGILAGLSWPAALAFAATWLGVAFLTRFSSLAALTANEPEFQPGFEEVDTSVVAAVPIYGVYDWTNRDGTGRADMEGLLARLVLKSKLRDDRELWHNASTMSWVGPDAPPFFVIHGANDTLVPVEQARAFVAMLRAESKNPVAYAELPGAQHAFELFDSPRTLQTVPAIHRFLEAVRERSSQDPEIDESEAAELRADEA
jgi:hypothetical protein